MRGDLIYKILDFIADSTINQAHFLLAFLRAGYGATSSKINKEYDFLNRNSLKRIFEREERRHLQKYISRLKAQGLIFENSAGTLKLSKLGKNKLNKLSVVHLASSESFKKQKSDRVVIISYDIPVAFNRERDTLRRVLRLLGFRFVHRSVWVGQVHLPQNFFLTLNKLKILKFIEILEVTKNGTLKNLE